MTLIREPAEILKWLQYRLRVLFFWLAGRKNNVSPAELVRYLARPPYSVLARSKIVTITSDEHNSIIKLRGLAAPLHYPRSLGVQSLYQVIGESLFAYNWHYYEIPETRVAPDDIVVDCGAAEGLFSLCVAERCRQLVIIEPIPVYQQSLRATFRNYPNVTIVRCAISDEPGSGFVTSDEIRSEMTTQRTGIATEITTIDEMFFKNQRTITYIKADLEGYELRLINGAAETIRQSKPKIAITTYHEPGHADKIQKALSRLAPGYRFKVKGIEGRVGDPVMLHAWHQP